MMTSGLLMWADFEPLGPGQFADDRVPERI